MKVSRVAKLVILGIQYKSWMKERFSSDELLPSNMNIFNVFSTNYYLQTWTFLMYFVNWHGSSQIKLSDFGGNTLFFHFFFVNFSWSCGKKSWWLARLFKNITQGGKDLIKHYVQDPTTKGIKIPKRYRHKSM